MGGTFCHRKTKKVAMYERRRAFYGERDAILDLTKGWDMHLWLELSLINKILA